MGNAARGDLDLIRSYRRPYCGAGVDALFTIDKEPSADTLRIEAIDHQWWFEFKYPDEEGETILTTANELHIREAKPIAFDLRSVDVNLLVLGCLRCPKSLEFAPTGVCGWLSLRQRTTTVRVPMRSPVSDAA